MGHKLKGDFVIIDGTEVILKPKALPQNPNNGHLAVDIADNKLKAWNSAKNRWLIVGDAEDIKFNNASNGFTSTNVQAAIEEAKNTASGGTARWMASPGFDGTASSGRYLEFSSNVDSNQSGLVIPLACTLKEISLALNTSGTVTFTVYTWNGTTETSITTISTSSSRKAIVTGLNIALVTNAEIRVKCTSGSGARPIVFMFFKNI